MGQIEPHVALCENPCLTETSGVSLNQPDKLRTKRRKRMKTHNELEFDALVVGGGIAGLQAALDLAEQNYRVAVIEKDASIGGKMIRLSKVFPTLDCASCITTPKMAAAAHHDKIVIL